ncbi:SWIM zinc finger family protein [Halobacterium sp. CBA1126]|uniref:SWIM zinc finger family protein n=1 Tax=Halobacterium sp. CBA1126 TaxID=2668074 RepID=UPI002F91419F
MGWESYEFTVVSPHQVEVTNASWGHEKADHSYIVGIEEGAGIPVPAECGCKADQHREDYDCKHKVALASVGGPVVLQAAVEYATPAEDTGETTTQTLEDKLRADGGAITEETVEESPAFYAENPGKCDCDSLGDNFPCWPCVRAERKELPE